MIIAALGRNCVAGVVVVFLLRSGDCKTDNETIEKIEKGYERSFVLGEETRAHF